MNYLVVVLVLISKMSYHACLSLFHLFHLLVSFTKKLSLIITIYLNQIYRLVSVPVDLICDHKELWLH